MIREIIWATTLSLIISGCFQIGNSQVAAVNPTMSAQANFPAKITEVKTTGEPNNYTFAVTLGVRRCQSSTGCNCCLNPESHRLFSVNSQQ